MAQASSSSSSFDQWIRSLLNELQSNDDDMSDLVQYLLGIVTSDSETDDEKLVAIGELLADLDLKHNHPVEALSQQILERWYSAGQQAATTLPKTSPIADDDAINTALINAMNQIESTARQQKPNKTNEDAALKKHRDQVLAKYSEVSDDEFGYDDETNGATSQDNGLFQNNNSQEIDERDKRAREAAHEVNIDTHCSSRGRSASCFQAHKKQQERNKVDAANQKQKDEERKKKAQQRAQKQERRR